MTLNKMMMAWSEGRKASQFFANSSRPGNDFSFLIPFSIMQEQRRKNKSTIWKRKNFDCGFQTEGFCEGAQI